MTDLSTTESAPNGFDRLRVDVGELYRQYPIDRRHEWPGAVVPFDRIYSAPLPLRLRMQLWKIFHRAWLDQHWLTRFASYWESILGGQPMHSPDDFHFLRGIYRLRHQNDAVPETSDAGEHMRASQAGTMLDQVFAQQFLESIDPRLLEAQWLRRLGVRSFIEFGAASAPVTTAYRQFFGTRAHSTIIDIETVAFHFGVFKFKADPRVTPIALTPATNLMPPSELKVDAIVATATFARLKEPLEVVRRLAGMLNPGGYLLFDFLHTDDGGLDTMIAVRERDRVLDFIDERFTKIHGDARQHRGSLLTVARLR